ncbi:Hpt domain-containing protein [Natrinema sp. 1APR25-10V2]|uniref:Hpt domain-containing protein n=1 Tax=Natrinema sp. 1APR25-10V2 TaxID=2951081 RepID=UPI0028757FA9|nr:Hpt domain-containing protein [Natrinema sp. 1APR25-10V2]MDS0474126.1 Hpt domain-containing protein [Natrinema sp. 1APR25-10V2]
MTDYLTDFVQESEERITELNNALLTLERDPDDEEAMENIFRIAHTLKGNCGAMGLESASDLAHAIEDLLDAVRRDDLEVTPELMDIVFDGVDELETMIDEVAATGEIETDPSATIQALREHLESAPGAGETGFAAPSADEIDDVCSRFEPPTDDDHDVYLVRLDIAEREGVNNGKLVVDALIDAFDLIGTDPSQDRIEAAEYEGGFDAVFATAVGEAAITSGLEPVEEVNEFEIVDVTDRFAEADEESQTLDEVEAGDNISAEEAQDLEVDDLLNEFTEFDDLDEMVEDVDDDELAAFEDMGEAGSFDDLLEDDDIEAEPGEPPAESLDEDAEASAEPSEAADASDEDATAGAEADADDDVDDASAVFNELKDEVEMVGFDELQDELAELEFDEFDEEEEVGMDELLGEEADDDSFLEGDVPSESEVDDILVDDVVEPDTDESEGDDPDVESALETTEPEASDDEEAADDDEDDVADADSTDSTATETPEAEPSADASTGDETPAVADSESESVDEAGDESDLEGADADESDLEEAAIDESDDETAEAAEADGSETTVDDEIAEGDSPATTDDTAAEATTDAEPDETEADIEPATEDVVADSDAEPAESEAPSEPDDASELPETEPDAAGDESGDEADLESEAAETAEDDDTATDDSFGADADDFDPTAAFDDVDSSDDGTNAFDDDGLGTADATFDDEFADESTADGFDEEFDDDFDEGLDDEVFAGTDEFDVGAAGFDSPVSESGADDESPESASFGDDSTDDDDSDDVVRTVEEPSLEIPDLTVPETDDRTDDDTQADEIQSVRVDVEQIDSLLTLVEGLVTSRVRLRHAADADGDNDALETELDALSELTTDLQETVMDIRLVPLQTVTNRLPRVVRDIARDQDKEVAFEMNGENVELDRSILDRIGDPLIHLVRNAVDHGIEPPEEREEADKPREGTVEVHADRDRDRVTISVEDDGSGLDPDRLRAEAVDAGVLEESEAVDLPDEEAYELIFHPGLSTVDEVTDISGRGVGMDVVKRTIEDLDGTVAIDSEAGEGTTVTMELPVTVAIDDILFVESGGEEFGVPTKAVSDIESASALESTGEQSVLPSDDGDLPVIPLADVLETPAPGANGDGMVVRIRGDVREVALHCDRVHGQQEVVVKPFEGFMSGVPGLSGATVRGRGEVVNILDVTTL